MLTVTPSDRRYTAEHQWIRVSIGGRCLVGITDLAQSQLGEVSFVDLPQIGAQVTANEAYGTIESVKSLSDLFAPVSGKVVDVNGDLSSSPERVNDDPYGVWLIAIVPDDSSQVELLLTADQYDAITD